MAKCSLKLKLQDINTKASEFIASRKNTNNLVDLLGFLEADDDKVILAAVRAVHKVCTHIISSGELLSARRLQSAGVDVENEKEKVYLTWVKERYADSCTSLCHLLSHENSALQDLSLCTLMKFVKSEGRAASAGDVSVIFPVQLVQQIVRALLHTDQDLSTLIGKFEEYMEYDDVRYFTMKAALKLIRSDTEQPSNKLNLCNTFALLQILNLKESTDDGSDQLKNLYVVVTDTSRCAKLSSHKQQRVVFQTLWIEFLQKQLPHSLYHRVLVVLDDKVMPYMVNPLKLSDFLTNSYNIGGATSLLALNGLFRLIHGHNLDYPDFYGKLYALLEPSVFYVKYRARFFFLLDLFLTSTHLPAYLVAAFIKRLCRLCLSAPPYGLTVVIPLVYNLILRHDTCKVMLHRPGPAMTADMTSDPYDPLEPVPLKCGALDSSLWELKSSVVRALWNTIIIALLMKPRNWSNLCPDRNLTLLQCLLLIWMI